MKNNLLPSALTRCGQLLKSTGLAMCLIATSMAGAFANNGVTASSDAISVVQQSISVRGQVVDQAGEPVIGANILEKGTTNGTITDIDGNFALNVQPNATLVISYIGYTTKEVAVNNQRTLKVTLTEDSEALEEVVVIGYGTVKKADLAGAVAVVDNKAFRDQPINDVSETLQGRLAGVQVESSGVPGGDVKIRVRGAKF